MSFIKAPKSLYDHAARYSPALRDFVVALHWLAYQKTGQYERLETSGPELVELLALGTRTVWRRLQQAEDAGYIKRTTERAMPIAIAFCDPDPRCATSDTPHPHDVAPPPATDAPDTSTGAPAASTGPRPTSAGPPPAAGECATRGTPASCATRGTLLKDLDHDDTSLDPEQHHHQISGECATRGTPGEECATRGTPDEREAIGDALWTFADWTGLPLDQVVAAELAASCALGQVQAGILDAAAMAQTLDNPIAYLVNRLRQGQWAGEPPLNAETWARYEEHDYRDLLTYFRGGRYGHLIEH